MAMVCRTIFLPIPAAELSSRDLVIDMRVPYPTRGPPWQQLCLGRNSSRLFQEFEWLQAFHLKRDPILCLGSGLTPILGTCRATRREIYLRKGHRVLPITSARS